MKMTSNEKGFLVYAGDILQKRSDGTEAINWKSIYGLKLSKNSSGVITGI